MKNTFPFPSLVNLRDNGWKHFEVRTVRYALRYIGILLDKD